MPTVSLVQLAFYTIMVMFGIVGNAVVIGVVGKSVLREGRRAPGSDIILVNMALSNLMVSLVRNVLLVLADSGLQLYLSKDWCRVFMALWVWVRCANVWSTCYLSAFHHYTLHRLAPAQSKAYGPRALPKALLLGLSLVWTLNLLYSIPAYVYSKKGGSNITETFMMTSTTTRPLLGCVWDFPTQNAGLVYSTTSLVIHEVFPIVLMSVTNMSSLYTLYGHGRGHSVGSTMKDTPGVHRVPAERRAAKVILALVTLFVLSWGTSIITINNYTGVRADILATTARFANSAFIALSPVVLAVGHRRIRAVVKAMLIHWPGWITVSP